MPVHAGRLRVVTKEDGRVIEAANLKVVASAETSALGVQDYVLCCTKGNQLPAALDALRHLVGVDTCCLFVQVCALFADMALVVCGATAG